MIGPNMVLISPIQPQLFPSLLVISPILPMISHQKTHHQGEVLARSWASRPSLHQAPGPCVAIWEPLVKLSGYAAVPSRSGNLAKLWRFCYKYETIILYIMHTYIDIYKASSKFAVPRNDRRQFSESPTVLQGFGNLRFWYRFFVSPLWFFIVLCNPAFGMITSRLLSWTQISNIPHIAIEAEIDQAGNSENLVVSS